MLHSIPPEGHGPLGAPMRHAIETCVHCGFCLAACPTYRQLGQEMDTPRGRIVLMKQVLEGSLAASEAQAHVDRCLGCLACEPACPSGVPYRDLISPFRTWAEPAFHRPWPQRLTRWVAAQTIPFPGRMRMALRVGKVVRRLRGCLPQAMQPMLDLLPADVPPRASWPDLARAAEPRRARVALLLGCAQQVLAPDITAAAIDVLTRNGVEVVIPRGQQCCGGLAWHTGDGVAAQRFARANVRAFPEDVDAILTTAAGCGSALREYHHVLRGTELAPAGERLRVKVQDVSAFLAQLGLREPLHGFGRPVRVAYHDACHLSNAQNVRLEPRRLLASIPGVTVGEVPDGQFCCGSAGTYNIDQPAIAAALGQQKAQAIAGTEAEWVVTGNIGCMTQLQAHLANLKCPVRVRHTMQVLRDAYVPGGNIADPDLSTDS